MWITHRDQAARIAWTAACAFYVAHVIAAFALHHHWSHTAAYLETEKQSGWGGGLYVNYAFTAIWIADAVWRWLDRKRAPWINTTLHLFFAFLFFNATIVFASGFIRWFGIASIVTLALLALRRV